MRMAGCGEKDRRTVEIVDTKGIVLKEQLPRKGDAAIDCNRIDAMAESLYSEGNGRPGTDSAAPFRMVLIQHMHELPSSEGRPQFNHC